MYDRLLLPAIERETRPFIDTQAPQSKPPYHVVLRISRALYMRRPSPRFFDALYWFAI